MAKLVVQAQIMQMLLGGAHLWTPVLPGLDIVCELLVNPTGVSKIHNLAVSVHETLLHRLLSDKGLVGVQSRLPKSEHTIQTPAQVWPPKRPNFKLRRPLELAERKRP